ncbi:MAG: galactose mutarotase [Spirochaetales bacterium]|nr:galactose mutarotase [Candidatus Physcosoma equi]
MSTKITTRPYGVRKDGKNVTEYILDNGYMEVSLMDHGAIILGIRVPDKEGRKEEVTLGFATLEEYESFPTHNFGSFVGRVANRISGCAFTLDGVEYKLDNNNNGACLHGGFDRYNHKFYDAVIGDGSVTFSRVSPDMEQGFPGNLTLSVTYTLTDHNSLDISYRATTDKKTPVNLTNHAFFDLSAGHAKDIQEQELLMESGRHYMAVDKILIPTDIKETKGTRYDFTFWKNMGYDGGFDNAFLFDKKEGAVEKVASVRDNLTGRRMDVYTDQPSIQLYTGQNNSFPTHGRFSGFCLETQGYINAVNDHRFPSCILNPKEEYTHFVSYRFYTE